MTIKNFVELVEVAKKKGPKRVAVVAPHDQSTLLAASEAQKEGLAYPVLVGDSAAIAGIARERGIELAGMTVVDEPHPKLAARRAVELVRNGLADLVMNGLAQPRYLFEAALDRQKGLRTGRLLTDVGVFEIPGLERLLLVSDIGIVVSPTLEQRADITQNAIEVAHQLGIEEPKVAILSATEMVNPRVPLSLDAANLSKMAQRGQIKGGIVDGPMALDIAISPHSAHIKGIKGEVAGQADILIVPDIEAGSLLAKTITCFARGKMASVVVGGQCPLAMPSRADPPEAKLASLALGVLMA
ncbi:MAG: bifunctional enoyl-CoA hydratase/phosphate acetyltransferase [Anaerolineales bacterium]|nr:bifunctional enoyl-CoA hydratase/phosphate acetyltransferase [Anaerolineales bacterium]